MKNLLFFLMFAFILPTKTIGQDNCDKLPQPMPGKLVNDFYGAIEDSTESRIEDLLREYNDSTSIEIAVVTMKDIGYQDGVVYANQLGNCWGVGKKEYDNGVIIFVSFEGDREWAIVQGKGMEQYLTDYTSSSIGTSILIPSLQKGEVDKAFENTIKAIIEHLGWKSWEMREYWSEWDKENSALKKGYSNKKATRVVTAFFVWIFYLALLSFIAWCIWKLVEEIKIRREIIFSIKKWDKDIFWKKPIILKEFFPRWFLQELKSLQEADKLARENYVEHRSEVLEIMKDNPKKALSSFLPVLHGDYIDITSEIPEAISRLYEKKDFYEKSALSCINEVKKLNDKSIKIIESYVDKGFLFSDYISKLVSKKEHLELLRGEIIKQNPDPDSFKKCYEEASLSEQIIKLFVEEVTRNFKNNQEIFSQSSALYKEIDSLKTGDKARYGKLLEDMKNKNPKNVWKNLEESFLKIERILSEATSKIGESVEINKTRNPTSLSKAHALFIEGKVLIDSVKSIYNSINDAHGSQSKAKAEYSRINSSAKRALEEAVEKCSELHVQSEAKDLMDDASNNMKKAEEMLSSGIVDWVWLVALLLSIKETAERAYSRASSDISYYRSSNYSSSSSSSSSGSSFGGFGGGSFGGGGAGGHW